MNWKLKKFNELANEELYSILSLRCEVFIVEQNCPYLDTDSKDYYSHHLLGYVNEDLAAYSRLVFPNISYKEVSIGRVVTSPKYRRKELGKLLMQKSIEEIEKIYGKRLRELTRDFG